MSFTLCVKMKKVEGALVRLLGLIGRRGYDVTRVEATLSGARTAFDIVLEVESIYPQGKPGFRPEDVLLRVVEKLYDVESVSLKDARSPGSTR